MRMIYLCSDLNNVCLCLDKHCVSTWSDVAGFRVGLHVTVVRDSVFSLFDPHFNGQMS